MNVNKKQIQFANDVTLSLAIRDGLYLGIEEARLDGEIFLVAGRGSFPYTVTPDGIAYHQLRAVALDSNEGSATLDCEAVGFAAPLQQRTDLFTFPLLSPRSGTFTDRLRVRFRERSVEVNGVTYRGFDVAYEWESAERQIHWLQETVALAPGGSVKSARVIAQNMTMKYCKMEEVLDVDSIYSTDEHYDSVCIQAPGRGGGSQFFDFVAGQRLAAVSFFEPAIPDGNALKGTFQKFKGEDFVTSSDFHYGTLANRFTTAPRVVVAAQYPATTREEDINRWTAWFEFTGRQWREELGIARTRAMPLLGLEGTGIGGVDPGTTYPELLKVWASRMDWVVDNGFQAILLHTPEWIGAANQKTFWPGNNCSPWEFRLSDFLGGDAGLRAFCDACHARGVKVFAWIAGHLQRDAPILKEHPEWAVRTQDGRLWDAHYGSIHALAFPRGAAEWLLDSLKKVRAATGVDGIWFDSFANLTIGPINWQAPGLEPNAPAVLKFIGALSDAGFEIMIEGISQLGVSSWGNLQPAEITGQEELLINTSMRYMLKPVWIDDPAATRDLYFRLLAARGPAAIWLSEYLDRPEPFPPALPEWFTPLTLAYNRVAPRMETRRLVDGGALWFDLKGEPSAFFAFKDSPAIPGLADSCRLTDLLSGDTETKGPRQGRVYGLAP